MQCDLNDFSYRVSQRMTLEDFVIKENIDLTLAAIAVNGRVVPREEYKRYMLHEQDHVYKIEAFAGG
ncbi:MAG: sulfur carrier protein ThiS [Gammaproteobacteria bacterium]